MFPIYVINNQLEAEAHFPSYDGELWDRLPEHMKYKTHWKHSNKPEADAIARALTTLSPATFVVRYLTPSKDIARRHLRNPY